MPDRPLRVARLSEVDLPELPGHLPPRPGRLVDEVFVRSTPGPDGAEPLLMVHGLGGSSHNFIELMELLGTRLAAEAIDLPGFGHSPVSAGGYALRSHARAVERRIEARAAGPVHLLGNSLGGAACVLVAAARPDLVRTLTLVSPALPTLRPPRVMVGGVRSLVGRVTGRQTAEQRIALMWALCFADPAAMSQQRRVEMVQEAERRQRLGYDPAVFKGSLRGLVGSYGYRGQQAPWRQLARVRAPALVVWGTHDRLVSAALAARTTRTLPDGRLLLLERTGHVAQMERPYDVARAVLGLVEDSRATVRGSTTDPTA